MSHALITPEAIKVGAELLTWAERHLMRPHPRLHRPYTPPLVCPFIEASIKQNTLLFAFHNEVTGDAVLPIITILETHAAFLSTAGSECERAQNFQEALLIIFPGLSSERYTVLDNVHELSKDSMVERGLMIGQFHPSCRTGAIHNPAWQQVSIAPYPLIAMRRMVMHDILFLCEKEHWFIQYDKRYGAKLRSSKAPAASTAYLLAAYNAAKVKFRVPEAS